MDIKFEKTKTDILAWRIEDAVFLFFVSSFVEQKGAIHLYLHKL